MRTGDYIAAAAAVHGTGVIYGQALPGAPVVPVGDPRLAELLALADARVHARPALCHHDGVITVVTPGGGPGAPAAGNGTRTGIAGTGTAESRTGAGTAATDTAAETPVDTATEAAVEAAALPKALREALVSGGRLRVDPAQPVPGTAVAELLGGSAEFGFPEELPGRLAAARRPLVLAGSGVVAHDAVAALRALAALTRTGVLNTWSSKGVLAWHSRYHLGTAGLQARDVELADLASYDLVITTGLAGDGLAGVPGPGPDVVDVHPAALGALVEATAPRTGGEETTGSPLRDVLSAVVQAAWGVDGPPAPPTAITRHYATALGGWGTLAADAGTAGYVLGRTFPTLRPGTVVLPPCPAPGFAAAAVLVRRLRDARVPALALIDGEHPDPCTAEVRALARTLGVPVPLVCWSPADGVGTVAGEHADAAVTAALSADPRVLTVGYDPAQLGELVDAAGRIIAWDA